MQEDSIWKHKKTNENKKNILNFVGNVFIFIAFIFVVFFIFSFILPKFSYNLFVIKTGSMEPTIKTGSIILSKKMTTYKENDIITFNDFERGNITHRIVKKDKEGEFTTKGDFNETEDRNLVEKSNILGKVIFVVPFLGYLTMWIKSWFGITILLLLAVWIVFNEIFKIKKELNELKK